MEATTPTDFRGSQASRISNGAVQIVREYTGRGPTKARTTITDDMVTILMGDTLTKGEQHLVDGGHEKRVLDTRQDFQQMMRQQLVSLVETQVQRQVMAFMSTNHTNPDMAVEIFVLAPPE